MPVYDSHHAGWWYDPSELFEQNMPTPQELDAAALRGLLLSFLKSLCLADNTGDMANSMATLIGRLGLDIEWADLSDLFDALESMGVKTLMGS